MDEITFARLVRVLPNLGSEDRDIRATAAQAATVPEVVGRLVRGPICLCF
jgi:hypothetical protein